MNKIVHQINKYSLVELREECTEELQVRDEHVLEALLFCSHHSGAHMFVLHERDVNVQSLSAYSNIMHLQ